jgi:hypothetical protein
MKEAPPGSLAALALLAVAMRAGGAEASDAEAGAPGRGLLDERFIAQAGTFLLSTRTRIGVDGAAGQVGTRIDLERDLGLRTGDRFRLDLNWRISGRHHVRASYFDYGMEASRSIARDLVIRDTIFPVSATVSAGFGTEILELAYEYSLVRRNDWELLGTIGAHVLQFDFEASGQAAVGGQSRSQRTESVSTQAPLPVLGLRYHWRFTPEWYLEAQGQYFQASIDEYDGNIVDLRTSLNWMFSRHFGVGAGYSYFRTEVDASLPLFKGSVNWRYSGAQLYVIGTF